MTIPTRIALRIAAICMVVPIVGANGLAQGVQTPDAALRAGNYSHAIDVLLEKAKASVLSDGELELLGLAYMLRGTFFRHMHQLQVAIGTDYYMRRDTSDGFVKVPANDYYLGRYLFEEGRYREAADRFEMIRSADVEDEIRQKALIWRAASLRRVDDGDGQSLAQSVGSAGLSNPDIALELAFAQSQQFSDSSLPPDLDGVGNNPDYRLVWFAARNRSLTAMSRTADRLVSNPSPDYVFSVDRDFKVNFYDPQLFEVLAYADYTAAVAAFEQVGSKPDAATLAGICAFEIRDFDRATRLFSSAGTDRARVYLSVIESRGAPPARPPTGVTGRARFEWAALTGKHRELLDILRSDRSEVTNDRLTLHTVVSALVQAGVGQEVVDLINAVVPAHRRNKDRVHPALTAIESLAFLNIGAKDYRPILDNLAGLIPAYPVVANVYDMLQGLSAPSGDYLVSPKRTG